MKMVVECPQCEWDGVQDVNLSKEKDPIMALGTYDPGECPICKARLLLNPNVTALWGILEDEDIGLSKNGHKL